MKIRQLFVDARGCQGSLNEPEAMTGAMRRAVLSVGATIMGTTEVKFVPHGVTNVLVLAESHFIVTTWPEHHLLFADIFLCNESMDPMEVWHHIRPFFEPTEEHCQWVERSFFPEETHV